MRHLSVVSGTRLGGAAAVVVATMLASHALADEPASREVVSVTSEPGSAQPQVAVDSSGRIFVVYGRDNAIYCSMSEDGGKTFRTNPVGKTAFLALGMRRGPRVAVTDKAMVVSAIGGKLGKGQDGDLLSWRSTDGGATWTGPVRVNTVENSAREGLHAMDSGPDGTVFCAWLDLRNKGMELYGARSTDGGATWQPDAVVYRFPDKSICTCCHPSVAFAPDGTLSVMWRNMLRGARDMYLRQSTDGGQTFGNAQKLGQGTSALNACPMDGGAVATGRDGQLHSIWMRAGSTFLASPGQKETSLGAGVQGWMTAGPDGPYAVWLASRPGRLLLLAPGSDQPRELAEKANDPVVAAAPGGRGPVVAAWEGTAEQPGIRSLVIYPATPSTAPGR